MKEVRIGHCIDTIGIIMVIMDAQHQVGTGHLSL